MVSTGVAVLAGFTRIKEPFANFDDLFAGSTSNPNSLATALIKTTHSYVGWHNAFNVVGEIKSSNPVRVVRKVGFLLKSLHSS